jgi:hypothetical protein
MDMKELFLQFLLLLYREFQIRPDKRNGKQHLLHLHQQTKNCMLKFLLNRHHQ